MARTRRYTPPLSSLNICALFHQSKIRGIPMTRLANELVETALKDTPGWKQAQEQMRMGEGKVEYQTK